MFRPVSRLAPRHEPFRLLGSVKRLLDKNPVVFVACALGGIGLSLPAIIGPIRNSMGLPTWQIDRESEENVQLANDLIGVEAKWKGNHGVGGIKMSASGALEQRNQEATVYCGNLAEATTEELLWELIAGPVTSVHMPRDKVTGLHQGYGFVELRTEEDAEYVIKVMNMIRLFGKPIRVNKASSDKKGQDIGANLFVGQLSPEVDEKLLYDTFSAFGFITQTPRIMRDLDSGNSKGFGFVSFDSFESADLAIECMNGQFLSGRQIVVQYAFKRDTPGERHGSHAERMLAGSNQSRHLPNTMLRAGISATLRGGVGGGGAPTANAGVPLPPSQVGLAAVSEGRKMGYSGMMGFGGNQFGSVQPPPIPPPRLSQILPPPIPVAIPPPPRQGVGIPGLPQQVFNVPGGYGGFPVNSAPPPPPPPQQAQFPPVMPGGGPAMWGKMAPPPPMTVPPPPPPLLLYHIMRIH